jgi:hypothetical protein
MVKSRKMRWAGHVARIGENRNACGYIGGKFRGKGATGKIWVDNIIMDLLEIDAKVLTELVWPRIGKS